MALTYAQLATLKTSILTSVDAEIVALRTARNDTELTIKLNSAINPAQLAWISNQPPQESDGAPNYSTYDSLVAGKRDSWRIFLAYPRDFTKNKVRKWVTDIWGNATAGSNGEAVLLAATKNATIFEVMMGGNTANTGTVTALKLNYSGTVSMQDVAAALNLP